jgi:hypothetical protein
MTNMLNDLIEDRLIDNDLDHVLSKTEIGSSPIEVDRGIFRSITRHLEDNDTIIGGLNVHRIILDAPQGTLTNMMRMMTMMSLSDLEDRLFGGNSARDDGQVAERNVSLHSSSKHRRHAGKTKTIKRRKRRALNKDRDLLQNNVIINLSCYQPSLDELRLLNKGLGFVPSHLKPSLPTINSDMIRFERRLQLFYYFSHRKKQDENPLRSSRAVFKSNPTWWPEKLNVHITEFCRTLKTRVLSTLNRGFKRNLTIKEITALRKLKTNPNIIIKNAI